MRRAVMRDAWYLGDLFRKHRRGLLLVVRELQDLGEPEDHEHLVNLLRHRREDEVAAVLHRRVERRDEAAEARAGDVAGVLEVDHDPEHARAEDAREDRFDLGEVGPVEGTVDLDFVDAGREFAAGDLQIARLGHGFHYSGAGAAAATGSGMTASPSNSRSSSALSAPSSSSGIAGSTIATVSPSQAFSRTR